MLDRKWRSGTLLAAAAEGSDWEPISVPLRGPAPGQIGELLADVRQWVAEWQQAGTGPLRIEYKRVGGRHVGSNEIPCRAWIDGYDQAWALLGVQGEVRRFAALAASTEMACPRLVPWMLRRPVKTLQLSGVWERLVATVGWLGEHQEAGMYLRQVDVPGVDTKFIERHRGVLGELLDLQLDPERINGGAKDFEDRYGFRRKPAYVRFRSTGGLAGRFSELTVRAQEFDSAPPGVSRVYVVENEITYLAFPLTGADIVIFGGGYAVPVLQPLEWLTGLDLIYWGDIDTHGFVILNRLRQRFPHTRSMLMDRATLLAHRDHWVTEPSPSSLDLEFLDAEEAALYDDLRVGALARSIRLEQERISYAAIERALNAGLPAEKTLVRRS